MAKATNKAERVSFAFSRYETTLREERNKVSKYASFADCKSPQEAEIYFQLHPEILQAPKGVYPSIPSTIEREEREKNDESTDAIY
jgi:hypothetical protein